MDKIDIQIKDNKEFGDVAFLVDKPAFLKVVERLRKKWGFKQLITPDKFNEWKYGLFDKREGKLKEQEVLRKLPYDHLSDADLDLWNEKIKRVMPDIDFECDVRDLRIEFKKPETFDQAIAYAIVCGVIPDGIYRSTYYEIEIPTIPERLQDRTTHVAIYVTPQSQQADVLKVLSEIKKRVFKGRGDGYDPFFSLYNKDEVTNIQRDRRWYWRNLQGQGPHDIAVSDNKGVKYYEAAKNAINDGNLDPSSKKYKIYYNHMERIRTYIATIKQALKRYKKALRYT